MELILLIFCRHFTRIFFVFTLIFCNSYVYSQTVTITSTNLTPNLGTNNYVLQCNILNFVAQVGRSLAWTKDGDLVGWDRVAQGGFNGFLQESGSNPIIYSLFFRQVEDTHGGVYKCLIADGTISSYTEVASDQVTVQVPYFPPNGYPMCLPTIPTIGVVGSQLSLSCSSLPGFPDEVNLLLQRSGQFVSSGQRTNDMLQLEYVHTVAANDNAAIFTCTISGTGQYNGRSRTCNIGPVIVISSAPQVMPSSLTVTVGQQAIFTCEFDSTDTSNTISWFTDPSSISSSRFSMSETTFTISSVQLSDNNMIVVCRLTNNEASIDDRAQLMVVEGTVPPKVPTTTPPVTSTPSESTPTPNIPVGGQTQTMASESVSNGEPSGTVSSTNKSGSPVTSLPSPSTSNEQVLIIIIAAVGGLLFILIIVVIIACVCCYRMKPKPVIVAEDDSFDGSEASWTARADGAMTRKSRIQYHTDEPLPRRPESNKGFEDERSKHHHLLKIPDGLSTVTSGTMSVSPSLAYAMEYLNSPNDPMGDDDMSSVAQTYDSRNYLGESNQGPLETGFTGDFGLYSKGTTNFGGPPSFDPKLPGSHGYEASEVSDSGTFVRRIYDSVHSDSKEQEPDMPTYALPHRDRISKNNSNKNDAYNPNPANVPDIQIDASRNVKRNPSYPYVNTGYGYDSGVAPNSIYQSVEPPMDHDRSKQYF